MKWVSIDQCRPVSVSVASCHGFARSSSAGKSRKASNASDRS